MEPKANDRLVRAARELLRWDQTRLAKAAKAGVVTVRRFETGAAVGEKTVAKIAAALREAGVAFIGAGAFPDDLVEGVALTAAGRPLKGPKRPVPDAKPAEASSETPVTRPPKTRRAPPGPA